MSQLGTFLISVPNCCCSFQTSGQRRSWPGLRSCPSPTSPSELGSNSIDTGQSAGEGGGDLRYRLRAFGRDLELRLRPDHGEMAVPQLRVQAEHRNFSEVHGLGADTRRCFYLGVVLGDSDSHVAVSLCKGMVSTAERGTLWCAALVCLDSLMCGDCLV